MKRGQPSCGMADSKAPSIQNIRLGWLGLVVTGGIIIWLRLEDVGGKHALLLGFGLSIWGWVLAAVKRGVVWRASAYAVLGTLIGFFTPFMAILIIVFKGGIHGHGYLDLSIYEIRDILRSAPSWGIVGAASGFILNWISIAYNRMVGN